MIQYLLSSSICLASILALYHLCLSKAAMSQINRYYLLLGLFASFTIPLLTLEQGIGLMQVDQSPVTLEVLEWHYTETTTVINPSLTSLDYRDVLYFVYLMITFGLLARFLFNLRHIQNKISSNRKKDFGSYCLVLLSEDFVPYAFWKYIFISEKSYIEGNVEPELLTHEISHVNQKHTVDIIIVELFQIVFWFNPLLYLYKKAIQLNHEFIADKHVMNNQYDLKKYQNLLLEKIQYKNEISLVSNLNFYITKQRLEMMTKKTSNLRACGYSGVVAILFICLTFGFAKIEAQVPAVECKEKDSAYSGKNDYFKDTVFKFTDENGNETELPYTSLTKKQKSRIPPPHPRPDGLIHAPLAKGTVIDEDNMYWRPKAPPPPPPPGSSVNSSSKLNSVIAPPAPPAPPVPPSPEDHINDMIQAGAIFYINGKEVSTNEVRRIMANENFHGSIQSKQVGDEYRVYIKQ